MIQGVPAGSRGGNACSLERRSGHHRVWLPGWGTNLCPLPGSDSNRLFVRYDGRKGQVGNAQSLGELNAMFTRCQPTRLDHRDLCPSTKIPAPVIGCFHFVEAQVLITRPEPHQGPRDGNPVYRHGEILHHGESQTAVITESRVKGESGGSV